MVGAPQLLSGFNSNDGICWDFRNPGENSHYDKTSLWHCQCPAHIASRAKGQLQIDVAWFGRSRSSRRWFWALTLFPRSPHDEWRYTHGLAATEGEAVAQARASVRRMKELPLMLAFATHGLARDRLKELNAARRSARPPSKARDAKSIEYLYGVYGNCRYQITRKTRARIYFNRRQIDDKSVACGIGGIGFVDRAVLEAGEEVWHRSIRDKLSLTPPPPEQARGLPDLSQLKAAMAAAHPDLGGSKDAFIEARKRYVDARHLHETRARHSAIQQP